MYGGFSIKPRIWPISLPNIRGVINVHIRDGEGKGVLFLENIVDGGWGDFKLCTFVITLQKYVSTETRLRLQKNFKYNFPTKLV